MTLNTKSDLLERAKQFPTKEQFEKIPDYYQRADTYNTSEYTPKPTPRDEPATENQPFFIFGSAEDEKKEEPEQKKPNSEFYF